MQINCQDFLPIAEAAGQVVFIDTESTGTHGDYNSILVASFKPWHQKAYSLVVSGPGRDREIMRRVRDELYKYAVWVSYYGKMFDIPLIQARLVRYNLAPLIRRHHIDMYFQIKSNTLTSRHSQSHLLTWLGTPEQKMTLSPDIWNMVQRNPKQGLTILRRRCESDVAGLEALYDRTKELIREVTR